MHIRLNKLSLLTACFALQILTTTPANAACGPNEILVHGSTDQIECVTGVSAENNAYLYSNGAIFGQGSSRLAVRTFSEVPGRWGVASIDVPGLTDHSTPLVHSILFNQDQQTTFYIGGIQEFQLGMASAYFNTDIYVNAHLDSEGNTQNPTSVYVSGGVNAANFSIILPKGGSVPLTAPPVCIGKNVLQFDGTKYLCTPLKNLM